MQKKKDHTTIKTGGNTSGKRPVVPDGGDVSGLEKTEAIAPANYINTEFLLYGIIANKGGSPPGFFLQTEEYGTLVIGATEKQLSEGVRRLYSYCGVMVEGKQNLADGMPFDLRFIDYVEYKPEFDRAKMAALIERGTKVWGDVPDIDAWLLETRGY